MEHERPARGLAYLLTAFAMGAIVVARLVNLQLYEGDKFAKQAEGNRLRVIPQAAPRGLIFDRKGRVLASNRLSYSLTLFPSKMTQKNVEDVLTRLKQLVGLDLTEAHRRVAKYGLQTATPILLKSDIDAKTIARVAEHQGDLPGVSIQPDTIRYYPHGDLMAHVLGYTGEITDGELTKLGSEGYHLGDIVGKAGLERLFDKDLRGVPGAREVEVDARGRPGQLLREIPAKPGENLKLTLDLDLQRVAEKAMDVDHRTGAVVAMNPQNGDILVMASRPDFDPNIFTRKVKPEEWHKLQQEQYPFVNRALSAYPPGSIFKISVALAALSTGVCTPTRLFNSTGELQVGNRVFHDWYSAGFGVVNVMQGLQWSIDTVFYELGVELGGERMATYAHELGLGSKTGIILAGESPGFIPDPAWKRRVWHDKWWPGDSANMGIGQGAVNVTPLQAAVMVSAIANGGDVMVPRLIDDGKTEPPRIVNHWNPEALATVRKGLRLVVQSGTGTVADVPGKEISGKTGSAESGKPKTHGWFVCYGPGPHPTIAIACICEAAGHGGSTAGKVARTILDEYFGIKAGKIQPAKVAD
ncbi:MAG TPA: penicillin-binding protein 2 [Oscillatoriaceae cyanobacterium]